MSEFTMDPQRDEDSAESGALDDEGAGERMAAETQDEPVESGALEDEGPGETA